MREFTNHKAQLTLGVLRAFHLETLNFSGRHPEATLTDFERHLRHRVDALEADLEAKESAAEAAVFTKPLSGPLADPERQRAFKHQESQHPSGTEREAWWQRRAAVLDEIKKQGLAEAQEWECRACGAQVGVACHTAGGRPRKEAHFLRATDAELPYLRAYGLR
ncbi:hypothetical protein Scani_01820 [Streptomyces caniferus]|uniref:DNA-binding phage zinc finger domain-containing protein n=1 Tax=Streptomyces caniferus TaxID=285557 RepID=A0A640RYN7_9ACTN|nr:hypothetical protein [Streptomyces caniferus]GFE03914.1 hypothetical protein Scani_01820 [Streptomyces caniferus]